MIYYNIRWYSELKVGQIVQFKTRILYNIRAFTMSGYYSILRCTVATPIIFFSGDIQDLKFHKFENLHLPYHHIFLIN